MSSPKSGSPFSSDTSDNQKSFMGMKKLGEIIENYNISSRQMILDEDFVKGLLSFHRGMQTLSHQGFCNHLRALASQFHHLALMSSEFLHLSKSDQRKLLARNVPLYIQYILAKYINR